MDNKLARLFVKRDILTGERKFTLVGYLTAAILAMVLLAVLAAGARFALGGLKPVGRRPLEPMSTPTAPPPATATAPPPATAGGCPTSWTVWKTVDPLTRREFYDAPPEIKAWVKSDYLRLYHTWTPTTLEGYTPPNDAMKEVPVENCDARVIVVTDFSADGLSCTLADYREHCTIRVYSWPDKNLLRTIERDPEVRVYRMKYSAAGSVWQQEGSPQCMPLPDGIPFIVSQRAGR